MNQLTLFGFAAVSLMLVFYAGVALQRWHRRGAP
jgi:hypothetical protein